MSKTASSRARKLKSESNCVTLDNLFNFPVFHLKNGDNNSPYLLGLLRALNELMHVKYSKHYLTYSSCLIVNMINVIKAFYSICIHLFNKYLLSTYYITGTLLSIKIIKKKERERD